MLMIYAYEVALKVYFVWAFLNINFKGCWGSLVDETLLGEFIRDKNLRNDFLLSLN